MGQYHYLVNLTKKQFVHPHEIGNGLKLKEQIGWDYSTSTVLFMLVAASTGRGGGDFHCEHPLLGSWAGDRIALVGDYAEADDIPGNDAPKIYEAIAGDSPRGGWVNISPQVREMVAKEFNIHYKGDSGWLEIGEGPAPEPQKKGWVEANPLIQFYYPKSDGSGSYYRKVRVIAADATYICGLDTGDKNRYKKFRRNRITMWKGLPIGEFNPQSVS